MFAYLFAAHASPAIVCDGNVPGVAFLEIGLDENALAGPKHDNCQRGGECNRRGDSASQPAATGLESIARGRGDGLGAHQTCSARQRRGLKSDNYARCKLPRNGHVVHSDLQRSFEALVLSEHAATVGGLGKLVAKRAELRVI